VLPLAAQNNSTATTAAAAQPTVTTTSAQTQETAPALSYGVADVVKLTQAQVAENIILTYVQNSGTTYSLGPKEVVYLKEQGVSDTVLAAMLNKQTSGNDAANPAQAQPITAPPAAWPGMAVPAPDYSYAAPVPVFNPNPAPAPEPAASTLYVIPYPTGQRTYASPYIYYGGGYSYSCYPYPRYGVSYYRYGTYGHSHGRWHH
jgi:hypothetical protein